MKKIILTLLSATLLLSSPAVVVEKKEKLQINKHAKITALIEFSIAQKEAQRGIKAQLRKQRSQKLDAALKEKAIIRDEES